MACCQMSVIKKLPLLVFGLAALAAFAQTNDYRIAPGATDNLQAFLNKPGPVQPAIVSPLGKNWFYLVTDAQVFSDEVSISQIITVLTDWDNHTTYFQSKKNRLQSAVVERNAGEFIIDFTAITPVLGFQIKTPYRASAKISENTGASVYADIRQLDSDSASNNTIKHLVASRYAQEITVGGRTYTYIRFYIAHELNASILPAARSILQRSADDAIVETLHMIIAAAKGK